MVNRLLALPAVLCLVLGGVLGAWGWTQRDEARSRIIPAEDDEGGFFGRRGRPADEEPPVGGPFAEQDDGTNRFCFELDAAARLDVTLLRFIATDPGPSGPGGPAAPTSVVTDVTDPVSLGRTLVAILDPSAPEIYLLDGPDPTVRMGEMGAAVETALAAGRDPLTDAEVRQAAAALLPIVAELC